MKTLRWFLMLILFSLAVEATFATTPDSQRLKEEYEALNGMPRSTTTFVLYNPVNIPDDCNITYVDAAKASRLIAEENAVIYFGAAWCPWCRNIIPLLLEEAMNHAVAPLYYVDVTEERDEFVLVDNVPTRTKAGTKGYQELLDTLGDYLSPYTLTGDDALFDTGEKRLLIPFLVVIADGRIQSAELCTYPLEEHQTKYDPLSKDQEEALLARFASLLAMRNPTV